MGASRIFKAHFCLAGQIIKPLVVTGTVKDLSKLYDDENQGNSVYNR